MKIQPGIELSQVGAIIELGVAKKKFERKKGKCRILFLEIVISVPVDTVCVTYVCGIIQLSS